MTEHASHCGKCGAALTPGVKFCEVCGQPVRPEFCEECGAKLSPGIQFCEACGSPVGGQAPVQQPMPQSSPPRSPAPARRGGGEAAPAWTREEEAPTAPRRKGRGRGRGCLVFLLVLALLLAAAAVAAWSLGWVIDAGGQHFIIFPNGIPFVSTPTPVP